MAHTDPINGKFVTLFGGTGFLGNYVAQALLARGARLRIASRHPEKSFSLKPLANLGQLQFARVDITQERSVAAAIHGADVVINLVGSFEGNLRKLMGEAAGTMAQIASEQGVRAFVQISAIGADAQSETDYASAKALGEQLVSQNFPNATIIRPSIIFGKDDAFINMFARLIQLSPVLPVFAPDAKMQMAYVGDVAEAIAQAAASPGKHGGKTYELAGPEAVTMLDLNRRIAAAQGRSRQFIPMPDAASATFAALPLTPLGRDQWALLKQGNTPTGDYPGFEKFGIEPRPLGLFIDKWMVRYRKHGRFGTKGLQVAG